MKTILAAAGLASAMILALPVAAAQRGEMNMPAQNMERMDDMMDRAEKSQGEERHQLMQDHMSMMMSHMREMGGMMGQGMMNRGGGVGPNDERSAMMEEKMNDMRQMMHQMLRHMEMHEMQEGHGEGHDRD